MRYIDYQEALGIGFNDDEKTDLFITKMQVLFSRGCVFSFDLPHERLFCYITGTPLEPERIKPEHKKAWSYLKRNQKSFRRFLSSLVVFANTYCDVGRERTEKLNIFSQIKNALEDCGIPFDVVKDADGIFIFPKGAKELDDNLVSEPLQWLTQYPNARDAWIKALKTYADATDNNASDCADLFRKALEQFFKEFFGSDRSLENYKSEYDNYMKNRGIPAELRNMFRCVFDLYTKYMNKYAKHNDGTLKIALEYIMYQTGSLIRFMITLKQEEMNHAD